MSGRGGARHFAKPFVESGLLYEILSHHEDLIKDFGPYEVITAQGAADPKGLVACLGLLEELMGIVPTCELHAQPLRNALLRMLTSKSSLNNTNKSGSVWVHNRSERLCVILGHTRRLARGGLNSKFASDLTALEMKKLTGTLKKVELREVPEDSLGPTLPLEKGCDSPPAKKKKLQKEDSDISLDSKGFPSMLRSPEAISPEKVDKSQAGPKRLIASKNAQGRLLGEVQANPELREAMALGTSSSRPGLKRPAAAPKRPAAMKKPSAALQKAKDKKSEAPDHRHWAKICKTMAKKPERSYLLGTKEPGGKVKLIVEVSKVRSSQYSLIIDKIWTALKDKHLSKDEAKELKEELCKKHK